MACSEVPLQSSKDGVLRIIAPAAAPAESSDESFSAASSSY